MDSFRGPCTGSFLEKLLQTCKKPNSHNFCCYFFCSNSKHEISGIVHSYCVFVVYPESLLIWQFWARVCELHMEVHSTRSQLQICLKNSKLHAQMTDLYNNDDRLPYWATQHKTIIVQNLCIPFWRSKGEARQWRFCKANTNKTKTNLNSFQLLFLSTTFSSYFLLLSCFCR